MSPRLSIVVPAYNEEPAIRAGKLGAVAAWRDAQTFQTELIVVDDESRDRTAELAAAFADRVLTIPHGGKAAAVMAGIRAASGDAVLFTDMDQATPITYAADLLARIDAGADVAIGSRGLRRPGAPPGRVLLSIGQMALRSILVGLHLTDTQCGFKAFARPVALDVLDGLRVYHPDRLTGPAGPSVSSGFDVEFLYVAQRMGYRIDEVPVTWSYADTRRVRLGLDAARGVRDLVRIAGAGLRGAYAERTAAVPNRA